MKNQLTYLNSEFPTNRLVLLHGWGSEAEDLINLGRLLTDGLKNSFEVISLSAPQLHPDGSGRQWYPLYPHKWDEVPSAVKSLESRLKNIASIKIPLEKTLLLGFSQGGAMALEISSRLDLAAVFAISSYPHPDWNPINGKSPVFLSHGNMDQVVPKAASQKSLDLLINYGIRSELYFFDGGHEITNDLIDHYRAIIDQRFNN